MITVRFESLHGQDHVFFPDLATEFGVPSDAHPDYVQEREFSDEDAAIALSNPNFVDAATGKNPYFTRDEAGAFYPVESGAPVPVSSADSPVAKPGDRVQDVVPTATSSVDETGGAEEIK